MSDERLRELLRHARSTGDSCDLAKYYALRWRVDPSSHRRIELAAYCGHEPARLVVTAKPACRDFCNYTWEAWDGSGFNHWVRGLSFYEEIPNLNIRVLSAWLTATTVREYLGDFGAGLYGKCGRCGGDHRRDCPFELPDAALGAVGEWLADPTEKRAFAAWNIQPGAWQEGHGNAEEAWWCLTARTPMDPTQYELAIVAAIEQIGLEPVKEQLRATLGSWAASNIQLD